MRLEQDPIHRHKDVLAHTHRGGRERPPRRPARRSTSAAPAWPRCSTTSASRRPAATGKGKGVTFHHHEVVGARMTRDRMQALRYSNDDVEAVTQLVDLHLRFHTYQMGWTDCGRAPLRARRRRPARRAQRAHPLRLHDAQRAQGRARWPGAWTSSRRASPSCSRAGGADGRSGPTSTATQVMEHLGIAPGPGRRRGAGVPARAAPRRGPARRGRGRPPPRRVVGRAAGRRLTT